MYGLGISKEGNLVDVGADAGIIDKAGAWYSYGETRIGQGRERAKEFLRENPEIRDEIEQKIRAHYGLGEATETADAIPEEVDPELDI